MGEAAAVLRNYERRTEEVLKQEDLQEKALTTKLLPIDYDLKSQATSSFLSLPECLMTSFPLISDCYQNLQVTALSTMKTAFPLLVCGFPNTHFDSRCPLPVFFIFMAWFSYFRSKPSRRPTSGGSFMPSKFQRGLSLRHSKKPKNKPVSSSPLSILFNCATIALRSRSNTFIPLQNKWLASLEWLRI